MCSFPHTGMIGRQGTKPMTQHLRDLREPQFGFWLHNGGVVRRWAHDDGRRPAGKSEALQSTVVTVYLATELEMKERQDLLSDSEVSGFRMVSLVLLLDSTERQQEWDSKHQSRCSEKTFITLTSWSHLASPFSNWTEPSSFLSIPENYYCLLSGLRAKPTQKAKHQQAEVWQTSRESLELRSSGGVATARVSGLIYQSVSCLWSLVSTQTSCQKLRVILFVSHQSRPGLD